MASDKDAESSARARALRVAPEETVDLDLAAKDVLQDLASFDEKLPAPLTDPYHRARRQFVLWSAILLAWELIGVDLNLLKDTTAGFVLALQRPGVIPWVLVAFVLYFAARLTLEWLQVEPARKKLTAPRFDLGFAAMIGGAAVFAALWNHLLVWPALAIIEATPRLADLAQRALGPAFFAAAAGGLTALVWAFMRSRLKIVQETTERYAAIKTRAELEERRTEFQLLQWQLESARLRAATLIGSSKEKAEAKGVPIRMASLQNGLHLAQLQDGLSESTLARFRLELANILQEMSEVESEAAAEDLEPLSEGPRSDDESER